MKPFTLLIAVFLTSLTLHAQNDCANAQVIDAPADATTSISSDAVSGMAPTEVCYENGSITMANWFSYTNPADIIVTVSAPPPADGDGYYASFEIFSGNCDDLVCEAIGYVTSNQDGSLNAAETTFLAEADETYYIVFDDYYSNGGDGTLQAFDFTLSTESDVPEAPGPVTTPDPEDGAVDVYLDTADTNKDGNPDYFIIFTWEDATTGPAPDSYQIYLSDPTAEDPTFLYNIGYIQNNAVRIRNFSYGETYYWKIVAQNGVTGAENSATWSFTTEDDPLSVKNIQGNTAFKHFVSNGQLNLSASSPIQNIVIYNLLGQKVVREKTNSTEKSIDLNALTSGIYLAKVSINGKAQTFKFVRK